MPVSNLFSKSFFFALYNLSRLTAFHCDYIDVLPLARHCCYVRIFDFDGGSLSSRHIVRLGLFNCVPRNFLCASSGDNNLSLEFTETKLLNCNICIYCVKDKKTTKVIVIITIIIMIIIRNYRGETLGPCIACASRNIINASAHLTYTSFGVRSYSARRIPRLHASSPPPMH